MMMQPITGKELDYVADSMSNEDLLMKQCAALAATTSNNATYQLCSEFVQMHKQHYQTLMSCMTQHLQMAPQQPSQS